LRGESKRKRKRRIRKMIGRMIKIKRRI